MEKVLRRAIETKFQSSTLAREINFPEFWGHSLLEACLFRVSLSKVVHMAAGAAAAAAAARKRRIVANMAYGVIELEPDQFLLALALEPEPLVVRSSVTSFWRSRHLHYRYLASVKGAEIFCESVDELALHDGSIIVEAQQIKIPSDI